MKKIAVGDLGEFWYGDYKEPFTDLSTVDARAIPGYPQGALVKTDDGKLLCAWCGKVYDNLGSHVSKAHGTPAREYKAAVGLLQKSALVSERGRQKRVATMLRTVAAGKMKRPVGGNKRTAASPDGMKTEEYRNRTGRCYAQSLAVATSLHRSRRLSVTNLKRAGITDDVIKRYFGTMADLRRLVGAALDPGWATRTVDNAQMVAALRNLAASLGRTPSRSDLRRHGLWDIGTWTARFGSYVAACEAAGLDPNLPPTTYEDYDARVLVAYATTPTMAAAAKAIGSSDLNVRRVLHRYGFPFGAGHPYPEQRKAWAAEMARRVAGWEGAAA